MIRFGPDICGNLDAALGREWLETNSLGGFASSTIIGLNTRRYHGLLVAATKPPVGRLVLLSKLEETLILDGRRYELSANRYPGVVHPQGHQYLREFRLDPFPVFTCQIEDLAVQKRLFMVHSVNQVVIEFAIPSTRPGCVLELRPLIAFRDYHNTTHANDALDRHVEVTGDVATLRPYPGLPELHLTLEGAEIETTGVWYYNFEYDRERERGLDFREDLFNPFVARFDLGRRATATVIASTERTVTDATALRLSEIERRQRILDAAPSNDPLVRPLVAAGDQFLVKRGDFETVIAGYHWFSDWGRDTMIALPGLTLVTGRAEAAKGLLLAFARHLDRGMLPNRFLDAGEAPEYNTVDATLWFFEAVRSLLAHTSDYDFVRNNLYQPLREIIDWHRRGTRYGIRVDTDGLVAAGEPGVQLTWMDAKVGDWVVTPRHGKPVEIQALWYNALRVMENLAGRFGDEPAGREYDKMAKLAGRSFNRRFWNEAAGCLCDVVDGDGRDASIRPNQILAVSLPHGMLSLKKARSVVEVVERHLLTPYGLRTLSPGDPRYRPRYEGDSWSRDGAYHQGTVWPWLLGPFLTAYLKVNRGTRAARAQAAKWLEPLEEHLHQAGLGQISEIFDGDPPHYPRGCIAQAWSVAEVLRAAVAIAEPSAKRRRGGSPRRSDKDSR